MLDIFQTVPGERAWANSLEQQRNVALPPPANSVPPVQCGFAPKFHTEGNRDLVGNSAHRSQSCGKERIEEKLRNAIGEEHGRKN
jgi:hypothetical protein